MTSVQDVSKNIPEKVNEGIDNRANIRNLMDVMDKFEVGTMQLLQHNF